MANLISRALHYLADQFDPSIFKGPVESLTKSSKGERFIMEMFPGIIGARSPFTWSTNRLELVNHFRGFPYVAIKAIAEEIAGIFPQMALRTDGAEYQAKRLQATVLKGLKRREAMADLCRMRLKYLPPHHRVKVLAQVQDNEELEPVPQSHSLLRLLSRPNPTDTWWTFAYKLLMFLELCGTAYIWIVKDKYGEPAELWILPSHWMWPHPSKTEFVAGYEVRPIAGFSPVEMGVGWFLGGTGLAMLKAENVIQIQYPNPLNIFDGQSPMIAVANWVQCSESIDESRTAAFVNSMYPGVILLIDKEVADPKPEERERLRDRIVSEYAGVRHTKKPIILAPGITLAPQQGTVPNEMDYDKGGDQLKSWLMAAFKVTPSVVGMVEETTFASAIAAKANFHQICIRPKLLLIGEILTQRLVIPFYEPNGLLYWKDATPEDPTFHLDKWVKSLEKGACTLDEYRQAVLNLEAYENDLGAYPILPNTLSPFSLPDEVDDVPLPALAALEQENKEKEAEGALERGEGALERGTASEETADVKGGRRAALGEKPQASDGEKARDRLQQMRAATKRLAMTRIHRNGVVRK